MNIEQDKEPSAAICTSHRWLEQPLVDSFLLACYSSKSSFFLSPSIIKTQIFFLASEASFGFTFFALSLYYLLRVLCFCSFLRAMSFSLSSSLSPTHTRLSTALQAKHTPINALICVSRACLDYFGDNLTESNFAELQVLFLKKNPYQFAVSMKTQLTARHACIKLWMLWQISVESRVSNDVSRSSDCTDSIQNVSYSPQV